MESFDMFLNGNFVALTAFKERYGVQVAGEVGKTIETKWQSSLFQAGQCGAFVGVFIAGPITNRLGYRLTTLLALVLMNATIFISFFVSTTYSDVEPEADSVFLGRLTHSPRDWPGV
jgi:SP family general alpha glucoside:H+ symporter-like MFS transporter